MKKTTTKFGGSKLLLACASFLAFASLAGFVRAPDPDPAPVAASARPVSWPRLPSIVVIDQRQPPTPTPAWAPAPRPEPVPVAQQPVARTRGT